jgi:homogentisate 1,2-dioxygenase
MSSHLTLKFHEIAAKHNFCTYSSHTKLTLTGQKLQNNVRIMIDTKIMVVQKRYAEEINQNKK